MFAARMLVRRPWALMLALGLAAAGQGRVEASSMDSTSTASASASYNYSTSGWIGGSSFGGLSFSGNSGAVAGPGALVLGSFYNNNSSLPDGAELTFKDVPFTVNLTLSSASGPYGYQNLVISGVINGSLTGSNQTSLLATVTGVTSTTGWNGPIVDPSDLTVFPQTIAWSGSGSYYSGTASSLVAYISKTLDPVPVPEPGAMLVFGAAMAGAVAWNRARRRA
jgi:hypothetical protein